MPVTNPPNPGDFIRTEMETFATPARLVVDPFSGSGSSLLAAKMLGRSWLGIELDTKSHALASEKLSQQ